MEEEKEEIAIICMRVEDGDPNSFPGNIRGECAECKSPIYWRNHLPEPSVKYCMHCANSKMSEEEIGAIGITSKTAEELRAVGVPEEILQALLFEKEKN